MNAILKFCGILLLSVLLTGCEKNGVQNDLLIKIKNISNYDFQDVLVNTSGGEQQFGTIPANTESGYRSFDSAYRYAYVEAVIDGKKYIIQPIDYVGERLLYPGKYTYVINADANTGQYSRLQMHLQND